MTITLNPDEEKILYVEVFPGQPGNSRTISLTTSSLGGDYADTDTLEITTTFPASFPGLDAPSMILITMLSIPLYMAMNGKTPARKAKPINKSDVYS